MSEKPTIAGDLMRLSRELLIAEIEEFYAASEPICFDTAEQVSV